MVMHQIARVAVRVRQVYTFKVAETAAIRIGVRNLSRRTTANRRYFFVRSHVRAFNGRALAGVRLRTPVSLTPVRQPCLVPGHPNWRWGPGPYTGQGGRTMRQALARPEQSNFSTNLLSIVRAALRDAVNAPSDVDALDISAAALLAVAACLQGEVRHG